MLVKQDKRRRYDEKTVNEICCRLRDGESLLAISKDPNMPSQRTLSDWVAKNHLGFADGYLEAKRVAAHFLAERALVEAFNSADDFYLDDDGRPVFDGHHVQRSKLIVDTIKWQVSKMLPKLYGDKVTQEFGVSGDLAKLIADASNKDHGLPKPIETSFVELDDAESSLEYLETWQEPINTTDQDPLLVNRQPEIGNPKSYKNAPSTPSNHRKSRRKRPRVDP